MIRLRRRFALVLCGVFVAIFLTVYFMINYAAPAEDKKPNFMALETKIRDFKQVLQRHDKNEHSPKSNAEQNAQNRVENVMEGKVTKDGGGQVVLVVGKNNAAAAAAAENDDNKKDEENKISTDETCDIDPQQVPQPDIQVRRFICNHMC